MRNRRLAGCPITCLVIAPVRVLDRRVRGASERPATAECLLSRAAVAPDSAAIGGPSGSDLPPRSWLGLRADLPFYARVPRLVDDKWPGGVRVPPSSVRDAGEAIAGRAYRTQSAAMVGAVRRGSVGCVPLGGPTIGKDPGCQTGGCPTTPSEHRAADRPSHHHRGPARSKRRRGRSRCLVEPAGDRCPVERRAASNDMPFCTRSNALSAGVRCRIRALRLGTIRLARLAGPHPGDVAGRRRAPPVGGAHQ